MLRALALLAIVPSLAGSAPQESLRQPLLRTIDLSLGDKDARLRLWPTGAPWAAAGTFAYPVKQRWFAGPTQMGNEPSFVDGGERRARGRLIGNRPARLHARFSRRYLLQREHAVGAPAGSGTKTDGRTGTPGGDS